MSESPYIHQADAETFERLVIQASFQVPVLVDFWAEWCQPCQMLMPILSKLAEQYEGKFHLVKVDTDEHQDLAMQYQVRSLPTVKIFKDGQVVDEFMGVQQESEITALLNQYIARDGADLLQNAQALIETEDYESAEKIVRDLITEQPDYTDAFAAFLTCQIGLENIALAEQQLSVLPASMLEDERIQQLAVQIKQLKAKEEAGDVAALQAAYEQDSDSAENILQLAKAYVANGQSEEGLELFIVLMKKDASYGDGAAKRGLLDTFEMLGATDPLVKQYRNRMFSLLY